MTGDHESEPATAEPSLQPTHYVGIGASAGGLDALSQVFSRMPTDLGVAYIVVQHLSPDVESLMAEILQRVTKMEALTAADGMEIQADTIYFLPPGKLMSIESSRLVLIEHVRGKTPQRPIDHFFHSLGVDQPNRGIGVVLSGTGSDGSRGLNTIKEQGGVIVVEDPETAAFNGMPQAAVSTGLADLVVPVEEIADSLAGYIRYAAIQADGAELDQRILSADEAMGTVFHLLQERSGINFTEYKPSTIRRRLQHRMGINQLDTLESYAELLSTNAQELRLLQRDLLIGVTEFFRDDEAFADLEKLVIPRLLEQTPLGTPLRVWSVGCSTGEEPYSLAIAIREALAKQNDNRAIKVFATDVDGEAIERASGGHYSDAVAGTIQKDRLNKYFVAVPGGYRVNSELRRDVVFAVHNVLRDPPFAKIDLVVCRNVLIYFEPSAQQMALRLLHYALKRGGVLFLGSSESTGEMGAGFATIHNRSKLFEKTTDTRMRMDVQSLRGLRDGTRELVKGVPRADQLLRHHQGVPDAKGTYWRTGKHLLDRYAPPSVAVDAQHAILHVYGDISRFLTAPRPGQFRPTIQNLIHEDLAVAVSTGLVRAQEAESDVLYRDVELRTADGVVAVDLRISYVTEQGVDSPTYLLTFQDERDTTGDETAVIQFDSGAMGAQRIADLERDLHRSQEHLQVTVEELESANEELQSSNEELMSSNEELQSTNEELQSLNQELHTVNSEYQASLKETSELHATFRNTIDAIEVGLVFLDGSGQVTSFTPVVARYVNITEADIGRPILHLSHELLYSDLQNDLAAVMLGGEVIERELSSRSGEILLVKLQPYVNQDGKADGTVISMTRLRNTSAREHDLMTAYRKLRATVGHAMLDETRRTEVLIVDDSAADRGLIREMLETSRPSEYEIHEAPGTSEALDLLQTRDVDLILLDQRLGDAGTGLESIPKLRQEGITCPVILMSGYVDIDAAHKALDLGVFDFLDKGDLGAELLNRCIRYAMRDKRTERYLSEAGWVGPALAED